MREYQRQFLEFAIHTGVLRFGEFVLKSGRKSPYFFNSGLFNTGSALAQLGRFYASAIMDARIEFDMVFGPAYKGIPLVSAASIALADHHNRDVPYAFNRKEAKDHGEGGLIVGAALNGRVLICDDVISAGTSVRESVGMITRAGAMAAGVVIALDRQEKGVGELSAIQEVEQNFGLRVTAIVGFDDLIEFVTGRPDLATHLDAIQAYRAQYGVSRPPR